MTGQPWGGRRVPFTLLGGYLGAGKTTVLNRLLRDSGGRRLVVLVNDVGAVNVDAALVADHDGVTMSLTNGCVCCSIDDDLGRTLEQIRALPDPPDHVVFELSGVADPGRVAPYASTPGFRRDGVVVVADADQLADQLASTYLADSVRRQLTSADVVLLSKCDLASDSGAGARGLLASITNAPVVEVVHGAVDPAVLLGLEHVSRVVPVAGEAPAAHHVEMRSLGAITVDALRAAVDELGPGVVRAKGVVTCTDEIHPIEVNVVGHRRSIRVRADLPIDAARDELVVIRVPT